MITRLKDSFTQDPNHHDVKSSLFDRLSPDKQKLIEELPLEEQRKLADKACRTIVDIVFLTETEEPKLWTLNIYCCYKILETPRRRAGYFYGSSFRAGDWLGML